MTSAIRAAWPPRRGMPELGSLDEPTRRRVMTAVDGLRARQHEFGDRFLALARAHLPGYDVLTDDEIRATAQQFMDVLVTELSCLRVPDSALRELLNTVAVERSARGMPPEVQAAGYQMGSREMLGLLDEVGADVGLPPYLLLAVHDSTWEFANEATTLFANVQHDLALERAQFDAERRSTFVSGVLSGSFPAEQINRDAPLFGLDPRGLYVPLAARAATPSEANAVRRAIASALRMPADRLLVAEVGSSLGFIAPKAPEQPEHRIEHLLAVGPAVAPDQLHLGFVEAVLTLDTAVRFGQSGIVRLADVGPRPLVLSDAGIATRLAERHLRAFDGPGRSNHDIEETTRAYLDCDQHVGEVSQRLAVHPNTVRYRIRRFHELTGLDLRRTEDLVTAWWLLNRRRSAN